MQNCRVDFQNKSISQSVERELGIKLKKIIADYNTEKIIKILKDYEDNEPAKNFLYFLSQFEFISYNLIYEIVGDDENYDQWLKEFIGLAMRTLRCK